MEVSVRDKEHMCFACGKNNPIGLKLHFDLVDGRAVAEFVPREIHQSWKGVFHGGLMATLLDEAVGYVLYLQGIKGLTARFQMRLRQVVPTGSRLRIFAEVTRDTRKVVDTRMWAEVGDGTVVAEATATTWVQRRDKVGQGSPAE
ncbi:MAG: PaaI family thioesterase [Chloroflexi bacterium]|nr:PaaI family thioesterase [Chloroflexota bacterium]